MRYTTWWLVYADWCAFILFRIVLSDFNPSFPIVLSESMVPALVVGDVLVAHNWTTPRVGDVVLFRYGDQQIIHRVVRHHNNKYTTKGDANRWADPPITRAQIDGVAHRIGFTWVGRALIRFRAPLVVAYVGVNVVVFVRTIKWLPFALQRLRDTLLHSYRIQS